MAIGTAVGASRTPQRQNTKSAVIPAPMLGIDDRIGAAIGNEQTALTSANIVPSEYGLRVREGYREWVLGLDGEVRTIIPFAGVDENELDTQRLFAATDKSIWDVTTEGVPPVLMLTFDEITDDSGYGVYTHYVTANGDDILFYADGENGLFEYLPSLGTWAKATGITNIPGAINTLDLENVNFIVSHKLRLWLVEKHKNYAWYLPILSAKGQATEFFFASKFKHGGELAGLFNWTMDGGAGRDDYLVSVSRGGDVIPYTGDDPSVADGSNGWQNTGTWFIGSIPRGNRCASEYGGNLYLLSSNGLTAMSDLVAGTDPITITDNKSVGFRIARRIRGEVQKQGRTHGFNIKLLPSTGSMMISVPQQTSGQYIQYIYSITAGGWGTWEDIPINTSDEWFGALMIGTKDGKILRMDSPLDNVKLDGTGGVEIRFYCLTSYSDLGSSGMHKRVKFIRPNFSSVDPVTVKTFAYYDYELGRAQGPLIGGEVDLAYWDEALWNQALWQSSTGSPDFSMLGSLGIGRTVAVAMAGTGKSQPIMLSWDIAWDEGGFM